MNICSDPELIYDKCASKEPGFENALSLYPPNFNRKQVNKILILIFGIDYSINFNAYINFTPGTM